MPFFGVASSGVQTPPVITNVPISPPVYVNGSLLANVRFHRAGSSSSGATITIRSAVKGPLITEVTFSENNGMGVRAETSGEVYLYNCISQYLYGITDVSAIRPANSQPPPNYAGPTLAVQRSTF
jgi:hypothetical protein